MTNQNGSTEGNIVFGKIYDSQNLPLAKLLVRVSDKNLRSEVLLAETVTDKEGKYEITWKQSQLIGRNRKSADILIKILTPEKKTVLYNSDINSIRFNAYQGKK
ncbi:MAG: hypothetical protein IPL67_10460 [Ignavibacteria bacterium]|nr:hypothetical protein [Ignavibacteria bacterium]